MFCLAWGVELVLTLYLSKLNKFKRRKRSVFEIYPACVWASIEIIYPLIFLIYHIHVDGILHSKTISGKVSKFNFKNVMIPLMHYILYALIQNVSWVYPQYTTYLFKLNKPNESLSCHPLPKINPTKNF